MPEEKNTAITKKTPATAARERKPKAAKIIGDVPKIDEKYLSKYNMTKDYASSFNWHLDSVTNENWAYYHNLFTPEECDKIIEIGTEGILSSPLTYGTVGKLVRSQDDIEKIVKIRRSPISWIRSDLEDTNWIFQRIGTCVKNINNQFFNYDLTEIQSLQFTSYLAEDQGFYGKHIDMAYQSNSTRKLSVTIQLSNSEDYTGGDLLLHTKNEPERPHRNRGTAVFFPGYTLHEVTPVTQGTRYSLVAWVLGPRFK